MEKTSFHIAAPETFYLKTLRWLRTKEVFIVLDGNKKTFPAHDFSYSGMDVMVATDPVAFYGETDLEALMDIAAEGNFLAGLVSYDLKNRFEQLNSSNLIYTDFPEVCFFKPGITLFISGGEVTIQATDATAVFQCIENTEALQIQPAPAPSQATYLLDKTSYIKKIHALQQEILQGNIYEINFCNAIQGQWKGLDPFSAWWLLKQQHPAPFSAFIKYGDELALCTSPERFLVKRAGKIITQPIKGTAPRSSNPEEDRLRHAYLLHSQKEKSENVMIVDLCRNDLSRISVPGSVTVEELFGIYAFPSVHQMVSTVSGKLMPGKNFRDILEAMFPMGSMTGAPKISAMELVEEKEPFRRNLFSGTIGYISPEGDFDFNVMIRTLFYNFKTEQFFYPVGSAITHYADAEKEWEECLLKTRPLTALWEKEGVFLKP